MNSVIFQIIVFTIFLINVVVGGPEEAEGVKYANKCEGNLVFQYKIL